MSYRSFIDGQESGPFIRDALERNGPLASVMPVPAAVIAHYERQVPDLVLDLWEHHGIGDLGGGRLRLCIPGSLQTAVDLLFSGDPDFGAGTRALAHGAFGDLVLWHPLHQMVFVNMQLASVEAPALVHPSLIGPPDKVVLENLLQINPVFFDAMDAQGQPMFDAAVDRYGPLPELHIYGMQPAVPFDEAYLLEYHAIVELEEWLIEKIGGTRFRLDDLDGHRPGLREIGAPVVGGRP